MNFYIAKEPPAIDTYGRSLQLAGNEIGLSGLKCDLCGQTWSWFGSRLHKKLSPDSKLHSLVRGPLPTQDFALVANQIRKELSLPDDYPLLPGTNIGPVRLEVVRNEIPNFEWPGRSSWIITDQVAETLTQAGLTGWRPESVEITKWRKWPPSRVKPLLYELFVTGSAGIAYTNPFFPAKSVCLLCGRVDYGDTNDLDCYTATVHEQEWDGSDFCRFSGLCWGHLVVTERAKTAIETALLTNIEFIPVFSLTSN